MKVNVTICGRFNNVEPQHPAMLDLPSGATVDDAIKSLELFEGIRRCLVRSAMIAVSGMHIGTLAKHPAVILREADELLIFAPVAGG